MARSSRPIDRGSVRATRGRRGAAHIRIPGRPPHDIRILPSDEPVTMIAWLDDWDSLQPPFVLVPRRRGPPIHALPAAPQGLPRRGSSLETSSRSEVRIEVGFGPDGT